MAYKNPPIRGAFFEMEISLPSGNPNIPGLQAIMKFLRTTREWAEWTARIAQAVGFSIETLTKTAALDFPNMAAGASADLTVTVAGVKAADVNPIVSIGLPTGLTAGLVFQGWVSADDTVTVRCTNASTGAINPASATFRVTVERY